MKYASKYLAGSHYRVEKKRHKPLLLGALDEVVNISFTFVASAKEIFESASEAL